MWHSDGETPKITRYTARRLPILVAIGILLSGSSSCGKLFADENDGGAFEYRDVYLPDYNKQANEALDLDHMDEAWGIWGHNLSSVLPEDPSRNVYVKLRGGSVDKDQFCFSSKELFGYISDFIDNHYILADSVRFAILPNDNDIVCLCSECVRLGNTPGDATPAVVNMITKLAMKYPEHKFFTSYYLTTSSLPESKMPHNTGVIVSAMDYPLSSRPTSGENSFMQLLEKWKGKTDRIYVWDYIQNFDDYFTPYPVFGIMQRRFQKYRDAGVTGVFLNGSGNDYSAFAELRKAVLAQMLYNPDVDWQQLVRDYTSTHYPVAGGDIADFIIAQEQMVAANGKTLPLYQGVETAVNTYLPEGQFVDFYNKIVAHKKNATGKEKEDLELMTDAMAMTMLELKRINHDFDNTAKLQERLGRLKDKKIAYYNEGCWSVEKYLSEYRQMDEDAQATAGVNLLDGVKLIPLTPLDEEYSDITIVTDGLLGIPSNYHDGNLISSADPALRLKIPRQEGMSTLKVWMVYNPGFKIFLPDEVSVTVDGVKKTPQVPERPKNGVGHSSLEFDVAGEGEIILTLTKNPEAKTMAIDEIQAF